MQNKLIQPGRRYVSPKGRALTALQRPHKPSGGGSYQVKVRWDDDGGEQTISVHSIWLDEDEFLCLAATLRQAQKVVCEHADGLDGIKLRLTRTKTGMHITKVTAAGLQLLILKLNGLDLPVEDMPVTAAGRPDPGLSGFLWTLFSGDVAMTRHSTDKPARLLLSADAASRLAAGVSPVVTPGSGALADLLA